MIKILQYFSYGYAFIVSLVAFAGSDYLWKKAFFKKCLIAAIFAGVAGLIFELTKLFPEKTGLTVTVMFIPLVYIGYFQLFRWLFKKWKGVEPITTSASSAIGSTPLDINDKDGKKRKYPKDRKTMAEDFLFSFAQALIPIGTIFILLFYVFEVQKK